MTSPQILLSPSEVSRPGLGDMQDSQVRRDEDLALLGEDHMAQQREQCPGLPRLGQRGHWVFRVQDRHHVKSEVDLGDLGDLWWFDVKKTAVRYPWTMMFLMWNLADLKHAWRVLVGTNNTPITWGSSSIAHLTCTKGNQLLYWSTDQLTNLLSVTDVIN